MLHASFCHGATSAAGVPLSDAPPVATAQANPGPLKYKLEAIVIAHSAAILEQLGLTPEDLKCIPPNALVRNFLGELEAATNPDAAPKTPSKLTCTEMMKKMLEDSLPYGLYRRFLSGVGHELSYGIVLALYDEADAQYSEAIQDWIQEIIQSTKAADQERAATQQAIPGADTPAQSWVPQFLQFWQSTGAAAPGNVATRPQLANPQGSSAAQVPPPADTPAQGSWVPQFLQFWQSTGTAAPGNVENGPQPANPQGRSAAQVPPPADASAQSWMSMFIRLAMSSDADAQWKLIDLSLMPINTFITKLPSFTTLKGRYTSPLPRHSPSIRGWGYVLVSELVLGHAPGHTPPHFSKIRTFSKVLLAPVRTVWFLLPSTTQASLRLFVTSAHTSIATKIRNLAKKLVHYSEVQDAFDQTIAASKKSPAATVLSVLDYLKANKEPMDIILQTQVMAVTDDIANIGLPILDNSISATIAGIGWFSCVVSNCTPWSKAMRFGIMAFSVGKQLVIMQMSAASVYNIITKYMPHQPNRKIRVANLIALAVDGVATVIALVGIPPAVAGKAVTLAGMRYENPNDLQLVWWINTGSFVVSFASMWLRLWSISTTINKEIIPGYRDAISKQDGSYASRFHKTMQPIERILSSGQDSIPGLIISSALQVKDKLAQLIVPTDSSTSYFAGPWTQATRWFSPAPPVTPPVETTVEPPKRNVWQTMYDRSPSRKTVVRSFLIIAFPVLITAMLKHFLYSVGDRTVPANT